MKNVCITFVFHFSWVSQPVPREIENNAYAKFWATNKVHFGRCASGELFFFVLFFIF